jgi:hypothetical protein
MFWQGNLHKDDVYEQRFIVGRLMPTVQVRLHMPVGRARSDCGAGGALRR